jgi:hypothetical protein
MKDDVQPSQQELLIEQTKAKQRNTIWPDTFQNGRSVDEYLWKGSPDAPLVQRIGAVIFGLFFMLMSVILVEADRETMPDRKSIAAVIVGIVFFGIGLKVFLNGFRRRKREPENTQ